MLAALATLPAEQRAALVLVDMEGYPVAEVAEMLDCAVGTVKSRCSRGRARLAVLLAGLLAPDAVTRTTPTQGNPTRPRPVPSTDPARAADSAAPTAEPAPTRPTREEVNRR